MTPQPPLNVTPDEDFYRTHFPDLRETGETSLRQCQLVMIRMLKIFDFLCRRHDIPYWISDGTLLGAVRHQGFIPWDGDVDVSMLRADFARFVAEAAQELPADIFLQTPETDPFDTQRSQYKLRDRYSSYVAYERAYGGATPMHSGLMVDIWRYDLLPSKLVADLENLRHRQQWTREDQYDGYAAMYQFSAAHLFPLRQLLFEGSWLPVLNDWDGYLRFHYGDYMQLPPESKQHPHEGMADAFTPSNHPESLRWADANTQTASPKWPEFDSTIYEVAESPLSRTPLVLRRDTSDRAVFQQVFEYGNHAIELGLTPSTIVDCGAYTGLSPVYFANRYPHATIIAIEPESANFQLCLRNSEAYPQIKHVQAALWNENRELSLLDPRHAAYGYRVGATGEETAYQKLESVAGITAQKLMADWHLEQIDLLKVDIEGAEVEMFADAPCWIERVGVLIIELHERFRPGCEKAVYTAVVGFDWVAERGENLVFARNAWLPADAAQTGWIPLSEWMAQRQ